MNRAEERRQKKLAKKTDSNAKLGKATLRSPGQQTLAIQESLDLALQHYTAGRLPEANSIYQQILRIDPNQPVALHLLGLIAHQVGKHDTAVDLILKALAIKPDYAEAHNNLGIVFKELGKLDEAAASYHKALAIKPDYAKAHSNLGNALHDLGKLDEAVASYHKALAIKPDYADTHYNLGLALSELGKLEEAVASYHKALAIKPDFAEVHINLCDIFQGLGKLEEAVASGYKALAIKPDYAEAHNNLGNALQDLGKLDEAVASYHKALAIKPDYTKAHYNLGNAYQELGRLNEAVASYHKALAIKPDCAEAHSNLGNALHDLGKLDEAAASYHKALAIKPDYAEAHNNFGHFQLLTGDFQDGWENYSWRWKKKDTALCPRDYKEPFWDGSGLEGKTIFIYPEQGLGDTIHFVRYMTLVAAQGGRVVLEVPAKLETLFRDIDGVESFVVAGNLPPPFDCHAPLLDLPGLLNTTLETIPSQESYLTVASELVEKWADRLGPWEHFRIGIVWAGNPILKTDRDRSMDPSHFLPLTEIPRVSVYSLQFGKDGEADKVFGARVTDIGPDLTPFTEAAAAIMNLDLVVTVDTSLAHLAGALGCPVWTLLPFIPDWRWMLDRDDSPWYPTMRLFRQEKRGEWEGVIERVCRALTDRIERAQV